MKYLCVDANHLGILPDALQQLLQIPAMTTQSKINQHISRTSEKLLTEQRWGRDEVADQ